MGNVFKRTFSDPLVCLETVAKAKWPNGPECPKCAGKKLSFLKTRLMWDLPCLP